MSRCHPLIPSLRRSLWVSKFKRSTSTVSTNSPLVDSMKGRIWLRMFQIKTLDFREILTDFESKFFEAVSEDEEHVQLSVYSPPDLTRPTFDEATSNEFKPTKRGESFGPSWSTHWFKVKVKIPKDMLDQELLEFHWDASNEGLVWSEDGTPLQGLTGGGERIEWVLPDDFRDGKTHTFYIEMACNKMFGNADSDSIQPPNPDRYYQLNTARITAVNVEARQLFVDFWIIGGASRLFFIMPLVPF